MKSVDEGYSKIESIFDYDAMLMFQEQTEKMFNDFLNQTNWMPQDFKKAMEKLVATYNNGRDEFKKYVDENIRRLQEFRRQTTDKNQAAEISFCNPAIGETYG